MLKCSNIDRGGKEGERGKRMGKENKRKRGKREAKGKGKNEKARGKGKTNGKEKLKGKGKLKTERKRKREKEEKRARKYTNIPTTHHPHTNPRTNLNTTTQILLRSRSVIGSIRWSYDKLDSI
ncbi:hypothetical protein C1646_665087 [Rhizophagus diaphanus]|nr:hypothetical protein C1646_665087 [Rhizophagus diaphanus] [Rhizophagus sp. MUCL 43196]